MRANFIAQKKRLKSSRRFFGRGASLQGAELMSWIAESKTTFYCGFRATLQETKLLSWVAKSDAVFLRAWRKFARESILHSFKKRVQL